MFHCDLCDREFSSIRGMKIHRENHNFSSFERRSRASKEVHSRLDVKERRILNTKKTNALPEVKLKRSLSGKISQNRPEVKAKIKETNASPETKERRRNAQILYNLQPGVKELKSEITKKAWLNPEIRKKYIEAQSNSKTKEKKSKSQTNAVLDGRVRPDRGINGFFNSIKAGKIWYRSSYELIAYQKLDFDLNVLTFKVEPLKIEYCFNNIKRNYVPDILATLVSSELLLIEVKAKHALSKPIVVAKHHAAELFCKQNNMQFVVWTEMELGI